MMRDHQGDDGQNPGDPHLAINGAVAVQVEADIKPDRHERPSWRMGLHMQDPSSIGSNVGGGRTDHHVVCVVPHLKLRKLLAIEIEHEQPDGR